MKRKTLAVGIIFLFIVSSVTPMVIGYNSDYVSNESEELLDNLAFYCLDASGSNAKYEYYKEKMLNDYSNDDVEIVEPVEKVIPAELPFTTGPMDSAWSMFGHDTHHTGQSPYSTEYNPGTEIWRFENDGLIEDTPVISNDGTIYFGGAVDFQPWYLVALYPNGILKWRYKIGYLIWGSSPAIDEDGTIYVGSWDSYLYAINPNGTLKWRIAAGGNIASSPAIAEDGTIYVGTMGPGNYGRICAINQNGTEKWHYDTGYWITSDPAIGDDGTIYIGSGDSYLYAMYPNGTLRWKFNTGDDIHGHPSIANDGTIYIGSFDDYLYALYPNNGTMKWRYDTGWGTSNCQAIDNNGVIYVGTDNLYAIYPNGTLKWEFDLGSNRYIGKSSPAISADGTIYIGTWIGDGNGGEIIAVNSDGIEQWRKTIADFVVNSSPSIGEDGTVYIGSSSHDEGWPIGVLYAFNYFELEADAHGPYIDIINEPVQLTGSASGGYPPYSYHWDFGDEETSEEQNPTHEYTSAGNYTVALTVTDDNETVAVDSIWAVIRESNDAPDIPTIDGETEGQYGESYDYTFITTDLDGDDIWYHLCWGDKEIIYTYGPYPSGEPLILSYIWSEEGTYIVQCKASDMFDAESDWGYLEVTMPVNQPIQYPFLEQFRERFPLLYQLFIRVLEELNI